jgi:hypothetical protein
MWMISLQNEDDMSRESSPCKSPDMGINEQGTELCPKEQATESFYNSEEKGMDNQKLLDETHSNKVMKPMKSLITM